MALVSLLWFRLDLRLADNPALTAATRRGAVVPVYIWAPGEDDEWPPGGAAKWWLHQSLRALDVGLRKRGSRLILRRGPSLQALRELVRATGATAVFWNRRVEPAAIARDAAIGTALHRDHVAVETFNSALLFDQTQLRTSTGNPYRVFTPFWKACLALPEPPAPSRAPHTIAAPRKWPPSLRLSALGLEPRIDWAAGIRAAWRPGEAAAQSQMKKFVRRALANYPARRDRPDQAGTSRLSPFLHFGEISPRQVWRAVRDAATHSRAVAANAYLRELAWREFAHHLLIHFPRTPLEPLRAEFTRLAWARNSRALRAWQRGRTGFPMVDAGMRELWATGWMHNRVRMVVASFLTKDLLLPWQAGARWFWDTLVDADLANNTLGWQWTAGCGADAAPFFRIFNPVTQSEKFDPHGEYIRRWVPELARLPLPWLHRPWNAPPEALRKAGVALGNNYPRPIVDHAVARRRALAAFAGIRK